MAYAFTDLYFPLLAFTNLYREVYQPLSILGTLAKNRIFAHVNMTD